jgi:hypothetical protein
LGLQAITVDGEGCPQAGRRSSERNNATVNDEVAKVMQKHVEAWCARNCSYGRPPTAIALECAHAIGGGLVERAPGQPFARPELETQNVLAWRSQYARTLGYSADAAAIIARTKIDLYKLERLIEAGCRIDLALQIEL